MSKQSDNPPLSYRRRPLKTCSEMLQDYQKRCYQFGEKPSIEPIKFDLNDEKTLKRVLAPFQRYLRQPSPTHAINELTFYNPTKPIQRKNKKHLIARVETLHSDRNTRLMFFEENQGSWKLIEDAPQLPLQDPFHVTIHGYHVLGGVRIHDNPDNPYDTVFYRYKNHVSEIDIDKPFAVGPPRMKDIRLIELPSGKIAVFTRPQGGVFGRGQIGYTEINSLDELTPQKISTAPLINPQFQSDEWGGVNDLHLIRQGKLIAAVGHIAHEAPVKSSRSSRRLKNYYATVFIFDPATKQASDMEIIATADELNHIQPKTPELGQVVFSGGLHRNSDGTAELYAGINDTSAVRFKFSQDPLAKYEK